MVGPDPALGTLRVKWEYILDGIPVQYITGYQTDTFTPQDKLIYFDYLLVCFWES